MRVWVLLALCATRLIAVPSAARAAEISLKISISNNLVDGKIVFPSGGEIFDARGRRLKAFRPGERFLWNMKVEQKAANKGRQKKSGPSLVGQTIICRGKNGPCEINGAAYRGALQLTFSSSGAKVINLVDLETYVKGVVGCEIGSLSSAESLKAQAVIARTYAFANRGKHGKDGGDLCNREHCQVYGGVKAERSTVNAAVDGTRGIIMISEGEPISSMYHSSCGGMTSNNEDVYGGKPAPYLRRVRCDFCKGGNNYRWTRRIPFEALQRQLAKENIFFSKIFAIRVVAPAPLDRVSAVVFQTDRGSFSVKGTTIRRLFELPSTTFMASGGGSIGQPEIPEPMTEPLSQSNEPLVEGIQERSFPGGPDELFIQTGHGLARCRRPGSGWAALVFEAGSKPIEKQPLKGSPRSAQKQMPTSGAKYGTSLLDGKEDGKVPLKKEGSMKNQLHLVGRGYGHQIGLCQAGAVELGRRGWSYRQILPFYYSKVALRVLKP